MSEDLILKQIKEDLSSIKKTLQVVIILNERIEAQNKFLNRLAKKLSRFQLRLLKIELAQANDKGIATGNKNFLMWVTALVSAILIAIYLNNVKPAKSAVLYKDPLTKIFKIEKEKKGKK